MLNVLRESFQGGTGRWIKIGLLLAVAVSMIAYLGGYFFGDGGAMGGPWIARVDGRDVPIAEYQQTGRNLEQQYQQMFGQQYEQFRQQLDVERIALQQVIQRRLMLEEAEEAGLSVTPEEIRNALVETAELKDPATGQFIGKERYVDVMRRSYPGGPEAFEAGLAERLLLDKWQRLVTEPAVVGEAELERAWRQRNEKAQVDYAVVPSAGQSYSTRVSDEEVLSWYRAHQDDYRRGEARKVRYLVVDRRSQEAKVRVEDEQVRAFYDASKAEFNVPEQRRARHVLIRVEREAGPAEVEAARKRAQDILDRAGRGEDLAGLASTLSDDQASRVNGGDVGWFGKGDMVPAFESTAWRTEPGQLGELTRSEFGWHVIQVIGKREAGQRPLEEVQGDIRRQLSVRAAQQRVISEAERIAAEIGGDPAKLNAVAAKEGLTVQEKTLARGDAMADLGPSPEFTEQVFSAAAGTVTKPLGVAQGMAIVAVGETEPPALRPIEEVSTRVKTDLLNARARQTAVETARAALAKAGSFQAAAKSLKVEVKSSGELAPGTALPGTGGSAEALRNTVFRDGTKIGDSGVVEVPAGAVLYGVTSYQPFQRAAYDAGKGALREELREQKRTALLGSILERLQAKHRIEINEEMFTKQPPPQPSS
jgi:peptidyl-prolyl cis-trans isomerase D